MLMKDDNDSSGDYQNILQKDLTKDKNLFIITYQKKKMKREKYEHRKIRS